MASRHSIHALYIPDNFQEEFDFFVRVAKQDPKIKKLLQTNRANKQQHVSIALRELIKNFNVFKRKQLLVTEGGQDATDRPANPTQN